MNLHSLHTKSLEFQYILVLGERDMLYSILELK